MFLSNIPIAFPNKDTGTSPVIVLAGDIGGTKSDFALFEVKEGKFSILRETIYHSKDWASFTDMVMNFGVSSPKPDRISFAIAGPVQDGRVKLTNLKWIIDSQELRENTGVEDVFMINDLESIAYGLASLRPEDFITVYQPESRQAGNAAIIAPGTGLGESGLYWDGQAFHPFASEGGHTDFAPRDALDVELYWYLEKKFGHVSWERVVSGIGIPTIFEFLRDVKHREVPDWLEEKFRQDDPAATIGKAATQKCPVCQETLQLFVRYLAIEASNLALKLKSTGGLFIGGGIPPKIWNDALQAVFMGQFFEVGRLRPLLESVPANIIYNEKTALFGAAYYGAYGPIRKSTTPAR